MPSITQYFERWERWLADNLPKAIDTLQPGASDDEIATFEHEIGFELPDDVRTWFRWRNGQTRFPDRSILFGFELLSLEAALDQWKSWQEVADLNEEFAEGCTSRPKEAIVAAYTTPGWIPLAQSPAISNYLGIDLNPGTQGTKGQVINFGRDERDKCVGGAALADFVEFIVEEIESRHAVIGDYGISGHTHFYLDIYGNPLHFCSILARLHNLGKFDGRRLHVEETMERIEPLPPDVADRLRRVHDAAAEDRFEDACEILNADPSLVGYRGPHGDTLLHSAASGHSARILDYLVGFNLDPEAKNKRGETPLMTCREAFRVTCDVREPTAEEVERYEQALERLRRMTSNVSQQ